MHQNYGPKVKQLKAEQAALPQRLEEAALWQPESEAAERVAALMVREKMLPFLLKQAIKEESIAERDRVQAQLAQEKASRQPGDAGYVPDISGRYGVPIQ